MFRKFYFFYLRKFKSPFVAQPLTLSQNTVKWRRLDHGFLSETYETLSSQFKDE